MTGSCVSARGETVGGGYIRQWRNGIRRLAHVLAYEENYGPVPAGWEIGHVCHDLALARGECAGGDGCPHRACIEPTHLEAQTKSANCRAAHSYRDGVCHNGHAISEVGIIEASHGCKQCARDRAKRWRDGRKSLVSA